MTPSIQPGYDYLAAIAEHIADDLLANAVVHVDLGIR